MKKLYVSGRKPWRKFAAVRSYDGLVRKICCAILILEAAVWISQSGLGTLTVERTRREWFSPAAGAEELSEGSSDGAVSGRGSAGEMLTEEGSAAVTGSGEPSGDGILEKIFGIRLRLRDGAIEFYRQDEIRERVK